MRDHGMREHTKLSFEDFSRTCASALELALLPAQHVMVSWWPCGAVYGERSRGIV